MTKLQKFGWLIFSLSLSYLVEWAGSNFTKSSVSGWYRTLSLPAWNPPAVVFPIVWSILYTMIGLSLYFIITAKTGKGKGLAYLSFSLQLFFNFTWSWSFFYMQSPIMGLINIIILVAALIWNIMRFNKISKLAALLLVPYLLWVLYATILNFQIWQLNPT